MKVVALAGGTGSAKLLRGLVDLQADLTVICNVGDNFYWHGLYVCPDIDIAMYSIAGTADLTHGWGLEGDTFHVLAELRKLGAETWFRMGDRDLATSIVRTDLLRRGASLSRATDVLRRRHGVSQRILPSTDDRLETHIVTPKGEVHLQEFWVRDRGKGRVSKVAYRGASKAKLTGEARKALMDADRVVLCPANPVTSIGPILAVRGMVEALVATQARITALSPMRGRSPFSGPAGKLMRATGIRPDTVGVAQTYSRFLDAMIADRADAGLGPAVRKAGVGCHFSDIGITAKEDSTRLAKELIEV